VIFYVLYLLGGYALLSWLGAAVCAGTVFLLLRRASFAAVLLALLAIPLIAIRTTPRAEMFTVLLFAAFLSLLWEHHQTGGARLWLLPVLMIAWVNLHLGFAAGLALLAAYAATEVIELFSVSHRQNAVLRLRRFWPLAVGTCVATLANPWGWGIYRALIRQERAMSDHSRAIAEWSAVPLNWFAVTQKISLRDTGGALYLLLAVSAVAVLAALARRRIGAAVLIAGAAFLTVRHVRFEALFAVVVVIIAGAVLSDAWQSCAEAIEQPAFSSVLRMAFAVVVLGLAGLRSADLITGRTYLRTTSMASFGTRLSWWFPERAATFIERENIPGQIFNEYNEGGFIAWRLGPKYRDYIDGRAIPFGSELFNRNNRLVQSPPDSPEWQRDADRYDISTIIVPIGRYDALQFFPVLRQFCSSETWRPVYLDEVSAVFVRRRPDTAQLLQRSEIDCAVAPLPAASTHAAKAAMFNDWANAAAVLLALGHADEAFSAISNGLAIFPDSAFAHFLRARMLMDRGDFRGAEKDSQTAAALEPNTASWATLADLYRRERRSIEAAQAWEHAADQSARPSGALLSLAYAWLEARRPQDALHAFDRAERSLSGGPETDYLANVAHGRATAWAMLGNLNRAISYEEQTVRLTPGRADDWMLLADLYGRQNRLADAQRARQQASRFAPTAEH